MAGNVTALQLSFRSPDLVRIAKAFKKAPDIMTKAVRFATIQSLTIATRHLKLYPPKRPGQTYIRKHLLEKRWRFMSGNISSNRNKTRGSVWNVTPYAQWVQDEQRQAWFHRGRWTTVQQVTRGPFLKLYIRYFQRALVRVAENLTGRG